MRDGCVLCRDRFPVQKSGEDVRVLGNATHGDCPGGETIHSALVPKVDPTYDIVAGHQVRREERQGVPR